MNSLKKIARIFLSLEHQQKMVTTLLEIQSTFQQSTRPQFSLA